MLTAGVMVAAVNLSPFASTTAYAGHSAWSGHGGYGQRVQFRPWSHHSRQAPTPRWRPHIAANRRATRSLDRLGSPLISAVRARDPVVRAYAAIPRTDRDPARVGNLTHFRPDGRHAPRRNGVVTPDPASALQAQFRPAPQRRKATYEQLMAARPRNPASFPRYPAGFPIPPRGRYAAYWGAR